MQFIQYFNELTEDRRACPRDDLASVIANGEIDGCPMGDIQRLWYYIIVATAGHDTTSLRPVRRHGGAAARPVAAARPSATTPTSIANAADEMIRWTSPVRHFLRYATEDHRGRRASPIPAGGRVLLSYPSANRDEDVFADAMTFDVRRPDADKLLSFGLGAHFCLGAQFARREIRTMLGTAQPRSSAHIEPAGEPEWAESPLRQRRQAPPVAYTFT